MQKMISLVISKDKIVLLNTKYLIVKLMIMLAAIWLISLIFCIEIRKYLFLPATITFSRSRFFKAFKCKLQIEDTE